MKSVPVWRVLSLEQMGYWTALLWKSDEGKLQLELRSNYPNRENPIFVMSSFPLDWSKIEFDIPQYAKQIAEKLVSNYLHKTA